MTGSKKQPKRETALEGKKPAAKNGAELSDADLSQASGGALNAYMPTDQNVAHGTGGGAGMGDGSVRTNSSLIGLL